MANLSIKILVTVALIGLFVANIFYGASRVKSEAKISKNTEYKPQSAVKKEKISIILLR